VITKFRLKTDGKIGTAMRTKERSLNQLRMASSPRIRLPRFMEFIEKPFVDG
jgi:hypothetical protein